MASLAGIGSGKVAGTPSHFPVSRSKNPLRAFPFEVFSLVVFYVADLYFYQNLTIY